MIEAARAYRKRGWGVIPLWWVENGICACEAGASCKSAGKHPLIKWSSYSQKLPSDAEIDAWWQQWPDASIGIVTGRVSNLVIVDVDIPGYDPFTHDTYTVKTGRGGTHFYFTADGVPYPSRVALEPHIDVRGEGGYVVAPPASNAYGAYTVLCGDAPAPYPKGLLGFIHEGSRHKAVGELIGRWFAEKLSIDEIRERAHKLNKERVIPSLPSYEINRWVDDIAAKEEEEAARSKISAEWRKHLPLSTNAEFVETYGDRTDSEWLIPDWLPSRNTGIVSALPGAYKTWILLDLAIAVATGRSFLQSYPVRKTGPVIVCQQEDDYTMIAQRMGQILQMGRAETFGEDWVVNMPSPEMPIYWFTGRNLRASNKNMMAALYGAAEELRPALIIIDPLNTFVSMKDYGVEAPPEMAALKIIRDRFDTSTMIAHHDTKGSSNSGRQSMYGSVFLDAWVETGWHVQRESEEKPVVTIKRHTKIGAALNPVQVEFEIDSYSYRVTTGPTPEFAVAMAAKTAKKKP